jgi:hypothetical protein
VRNVHKLYLKWPLTARPIAKFNVLVCSYFVLIITDDVLVRIVCADVINKLFKFKYSLTVVFPDRCAFIPIPRFTCELVHSPQNVVLWRVVSFYQTDQSLGPLNHVLLLVAQGKIWSGKIKICDLQESLLVRNVEVEHCGKLSEPTCEIASKLKFPHHLGA